MRFARRRSWTAGLAAFVLAGVVLSAAGIAAAQDPAGRPTPGAPVPGVPHSWSPTDEEMRSALGVVDAFFTARDRGDYAGAYGLMTKGFQSGMPFDRFRDIARTSSSMTGAVQERRFTAMSWGLDVPGAPLPGVMVSIDYVARFEKVSRHCGYINLHEQPKGTFRISRVEDSILTNDVVHGGRPEEVEKAWAELSKSCGGAAPDRSPASPG